MTGNLYLDLAISLGGVGFLVLIAWLLGATKTVKIDEAAAAERLAFDEPDFTPGQWLVSADGRTAAALAEDGREVAFAFAVGDGVATRRLRSGDLQTSVKGTRVECRIGDPSIGKIRLAASDSAEAARWADTLGRVQ